MIRLAYIVICDECGTDSDGDGSTWFFERASFDAAVTAKGWRRGLGGFHLCPTCANDEEAALGMSLPGIGKAKVEA